MRKTVVNGISNQFKLQTRYNKKKLAVSELSYDLLLSPRLDRLIVFTSFFKCPTMLKISCIVLNTPPSHPT
jgi:hypothetical protein